MENKQIIINGVDVLKEKINMCFILLSHKLETSETIEQTIYDHLDVFVEEWNNQLKRKEQECFELANVYHYLVKIANNRLNKIEDLQQQFDQLKTKNIKISKTITEIKEITETQRRYIDDIKGFMFDDKIVEWESAYIDFSTACRRLNQEILQKISEVEE